MLKKVIVGNWKMNKTGSEVAEFINQIEQFALQAKQHNIVVGIAPSFLALETANKLAKNVIISAQNCHFEDQGAFTGEVSVKMLKALDVKYCLVGHSERRQYFNETNQTCNLKLKKLVTNNVTPIFCVGETLNEYEANLTNKVVETQLLEGLVNLSQVEVSSLIIAYEPVWSIGTGKNASTEIAQNVCSFIRQIIAKLYNQETADKVVIQYGGSVKPENVLAYLSQPDINGALVGGASLAVESFQTLIKNLF